MRLISAESEVQVLSSLPRRFTEVLKIITILRTFLLPFFRVLGQLSRTGTNWWYKTPSLYPAEFRNFDPKSHGKKHPFERLSLLLSADHSRRPQDCFQSTRNSLLPPHMLPARSQVKGPVLGGYCVGLFQPSEVWNYDSYTR